MNGQTSRFILALAASTPSYRRQPEDDCAAGPRTAIAVWAWERLGGGVVHFPAGVDPNEMRDATPVTVGAEDWPLISWHLG